MSSKVQKRKRRKAGYKRLVKCTDCKREFFANKAKATCVVCYSSLKSDSLTTFNQYLVEKLK